jgi:hypothetical protein
MKRWTGKLWGVIAACALAAWPQARADLITTLSVDVTHGAGGLEAYAYTLANSIQSTVPVYAFALTVDAGADLQLIAGVAGWDVTYNAGDTLISWSAPSTDIAIAPGSSGVFGFASAEGPGPGDYEAIGFDATSFQFFSNTGSALVPSASSLPEPSGLVLLGIASLAFCGYYRLAIRSSCSGFCPSPPPRRREVTGCADCPGRPRKGETRWLILRPAPRRS